MVLVFCNLVRKESWTRIFIHTLRISFRFSFSFVWSKLVRGLSFTESFSCSCLILTMTLESKWNVNVHMIYPEYLGSKMWNIVGSMGNTSKQRLTLSMLVVQIDTNTQIILLLAVKRYNLWDRLSLINCELLIIHH